MHLPSLTLFVSLSSLYLLSQPVFCKPVPQGYPTQGYPLPPSQYPPGQGSQYPPSQGPPQSYPPPPPPPSQPLSDSLNSVTNGLSNIVQLDLSKPATLPGLPTVPPLSGVPSGPALPDLSGALGGAQQQD